MGSDESAGAINVCARVEVPPHAAGVAGAVQSWVRMALPEVRGAFDVLSIRLDSP